MDDAFREGTWSAAAGRGRDAGGETQLATARMLARLLDDALPIPGTSYRIGIDPLLGLVPGIGDALTTILSTWLLVLAARLGAPPALLARMGLNVAVDAIVGVVPFAGDLFDAGFKANRRNLRLLEAYLARPAPTRRASRALVLGIAVAALVAAAAIVFATWRLLAWAFGA